MQVLNSDSERFLRTFSGFSLCRSMDILLTEELVGKYYRQNSRFRKYLRLFLDPFTWLQRAPKILLYFPAISKNSLICDSINFFCNSSMFLWGGEGKKGEEGKVQMTLKD